MMVVDDITVAAPPRQDALMRAASRQAMLRRPARTTMLPVATRLHMQEAHGQRQDILRLRMVRSTRQRLMLLHPMLQRPMVVADRTVAAGNTSSRSLPNPAAQAIQCGGAAMLRRIALLWEVVMFEAVGTQCRPAWRIMIFASSHALR